ncbi:MAG TPA: 6-phosphogluconolactonase [Rhizomicrobium sp.]|nr:6-phosphogluconolactonase [Rhizomicrobium sp.]
MNLAKMNIKGEIEILKDSTEVAGRAAEVIAEDMKGGAVPFRLALSGGSTPRQTYKLLAARRDLPWPRVELFFGDERFVPPESAESNYRMVRETLLAQGADPRGVFAIPTGGTPEQAADAYEEILRQQYGASMLELGVPLFDLVLLGLGEDGHIASLLPDQPVLNQRSRWVAAVPQGRDQPRITLTYPALESSRRILFLVTGAAKRDALAQGRAGDLPAGALRPEGAVLWLVDEAAAGVADQGYGF